MTICGAVGCSNRRGVNKDVRFYKTPKIITNQGDEAQILSEQRRRLWKKAVNRNDITTEEQWDRTLVCSKHFVNGEKAYLHSNSSPSWVPSLNLDKGTQQPQLPGSTLVSDATCACRRSSSSTKRRRASYAARSKRRVVEEMLSPVIPVVGDQEMSSDPEQAGASCTKDLGLHETNNPSMIEDEARLGQSSSAMLPPDFHCKCCRQALAVKDASMQPNMDLIIEAVSQDHTYSKKPEDIRDPVPPARASSNDAVQDRRKCCDQCVKMCTRMSEEYKKEVLGPKNEEEPQLLNTVFNLQPRIVLRRADVSENLHPEQQQSVSCHIKEEEENEIVQHIKEEEEEFLHLKEEEQEEIIQVPSTAVHLKSEDEGQSEERRGAAPPRRNCSSDGEQGLPTDGHDEDEKQSEGDLTCHSAKKSWKCSHCRKAFACMRNLKQHMKIHTGEKPFTCSVCGKRFTREEHLKIHTRTHTGEKPFLCSVCGKRFTEKGKLKIHTRTHTGEKPFSCSVCGQRFTQKGTLKIHARKHTDEKPFCCAACGQRFTQNGHLKIHTRTHTGEKPFSCSICVQRFTHKYDLKIHTRTHTGEKPFSCSVCGLRFSHKGNFKIHARMHTGEKPFSCSVCGQRYTHKGNLNSHTRTHTGEKPFFCMVCGQRFTQKGTLKRHTRTHTGEKPVSCPVCHKRFTEKGNLKIHIRTHTGEKPFSCSICFRRFS